MLGHEWQPAQGLCIEESWIGHDGLKRVWIMEVRPSDGSPAFRVEVDHEIHEDYIPPNSRETCMMLCDVKRRHAKFDTSDPSRSRKARQRIDEQRIKDELNAPPGSNSPNSAFPGGYRQPGSADIASQFTTLLADHGLDQGSGAGRTRRAHQTQTQTQTPTTESGPELAARLSKLQLLSEQGLLTPEELAAQRKRIIESI
jgi:hypothetical protein